MKRLNLFEKAVLAALFEDQEAPRPSRHVVFEELAVKDRSSTGSGFITELAQNSAASIYAPDVSLRWGAEFVAVINSQESVGMVVYVENGNVSAVEEYSFGGTPWPSVIEDVVVERALPASS